MSRVTHPIRRTELTTHKQIQSILRLIMLLCALLYIASPAYADRSAGKVVMLLIPGAMVEDITAPDLPNFQNLLRSGACAVMTTRTGGAPTGGQPSTTRTEAACLTLGSGARSAGSTEVRSAHNSDETVGRERADDVYRRLSMKEPSSSIVHLGIYEMKTYNSPLPYDVRPGLLGSLLRSQGLVTACIGNSDLHRTPHREATAVCMDEEGLVDMGDVGPKMTRPNSNAPYGVEADHEAMLAAFDNIVEQADFIVIDSGDVARAVWYMEECSDQQGRLLREWAFKRADRLLGEIVRRIDPQTNMLMVVSPCPSGGRESSGGKMTPVVAMGKDISPGLLTSASTRRLGIVANTDVAPTVLHFFGLSPSRAFAGRPVSSTPFVDAQVKLAQLDRELSLQAARLVVVRTTAMLLVIVVILGTLAANRPAIAGRMALLPPLTALVMLIIPVWGSHPPILTAILAIGLVTTGLTVVSLLRLQADQALAWISAIFCVAIALDLARGGVWLATSPFSYSPTEGSRYYGLGNELMGSLIGATTIAAFYFLRPYGKRAKGNMQFSTPALLGVFGGVILLIGSPNAGANVGGALAALTAAGVAAYTLRKGRMTSRNWTMAGIFPVAVFLTFLAIDGTRGSGGQSHLGRAFDMILDGDAGQLALILQRKLGMNLKLLQVSMWSKLLFVSIGALFYLRLWRRVSPLNQQGSSALTVIVVGALAALVFNDSGVVAAATCLMYGWSLAMVLSLRPSPLPLSGEGDWDAQMQKGRSPRLASPSPDTPD